MKNNPLRPFLRAEAWAKSKGRCFYCNLELDHKTFTVDHLKPLNKGGKNIASNCVAACKACNLKKGDRWNSKIRKVIQQKFKDSINE